ncbi:hypothetical protein C8J56DRAFT_968050 [Mycena floridula]|nr:hypothetical protein C8J56DRAFT_968050 [Mycena floridula]
MPAQRSKSSRRSGADGQQLVWTLPVEPSPPGGFAFTANMTPVTFTSEGEPGSESLLFPSFDSATSPRRPGHTKKKPANHIPRPPNAFILFRSAFIKSQHVSTEIETNHSTLSKIIGLTWQNLPEDERQVWHTKAKAALDEHKRKFPQYAFRPLHPKEKGTVEKRKVREVGPKDDKRCAKIAELLVEGKKGQELEEAIQEFDKHHVPEVVTRFEAPVTARMYRRSNSLSDTDTEDDAPPRKRKRVRTVSQTESCPSPSPLRDTEPDLLDDCPPLVLPPDSYGYKQESPFDFNTFAFETSSFGGCGDALTDEFHEILASAMDNIQRPSLSIETDFPLDAWTRSSSPMSNSSMPATPYYTDSPPCESYSSLTSLSQTSSYEDLSSYPVYSAPDFTPCHSNSLSNTMDFGSLSFDQSHCNSGADSYLDFATLVVPMAQYL